MEFTSRVGEINKMEWKEQGVNLYPDIILSDCTVSEIRINNTEMVLKFSDYGFIKKDRNNKYYRTDGAQVVIEGCDIESVSIKEIRTQQLCEEIYFDSMYDIETKTLFENVNMGKWRLEIVEEFYSTGGGIYIGQIRNEEDVFWFYIKMRYKKLIYLWNNVRYDFPVN